MYTLQTDSRCDYHRVEILSRCVGRKQQIVYCSRNEWKKKTMDERREILSNVALVIKNDDNYFTGNSQEDAQKYFDTHRSKVTSRQALVEIGIDPHSEHQVQGRVMIVSNRVF
jgi:hypothetical protein